MEKAKHGTGQALDPGVPLKEIPAGRRREAEAKAWLKSIVGSTLINRALSGEVTGLEVRVARTRGQLSEGDVKVQVSAGDGGNAIRILSVDRKGTGAVWKPVGEDVLYRFPPKRLEGALEEALEGLAGKLADDNAFRATYNRISSYQLPKRGRAKTVRERLEAEVETHEAILKASKKD